MLVRAFGRGRKYGYKIIVLPVEHSVDTPSTRAQRGTVQAGLKELEQVTLRIISKLREIEK